MRIERTQSSSLKRIARSAMHCALLPSLLAANSVLSMARPSMARPVREVPVAEASSATALAERNAAIASADVPAQSAKLTEADEKFLDDLERRGILFFTELADPVSGLMPDRAAANGPAKDVASIASVGFGVTAICIGEKRGWIEHQEAYDRCLKVLRFLHDHCPKEHGTYYHFLDMRTGKRMWNCEVSNIDTALLMAGVLTVRQHFPNTELSKLANEMYESVDWPWLMDKTGTLSMGWTPEKGFIDAHWSDFSEGPLIYLLAMGSRTHPLPADVWKAWRRKPVLTYAGLTFAQCPPLFTHQYPHCWFDLRGQRDDFMDYFRNSQLATLAQRQWTIDELSKRFPTYSANLWGVTASDSAGGYTAWGGPPEQGKVDGSVIPCAAGGSLVFQPRLCLDALQHMREKYGAKAYLKYGFVDAFNPATDWYNPDVIGIDVGATVLMAENCRSGFVWKTFMSSPEAQAAMKAAGFKKFDAKSMPATTSLVKSGSKPANTTSEK